MKYDRKWTESTFYVAGYIVHALKKKYLASSAKETKLQYVTMLKSAKNLSHKILNVKQKRTEGANISLR